MTELKPCPFCGANAMMVYCVHGIGANWGVECTETHAHRMEFSGTQDEVIKEWNRRVRDVPMDCDEGRICPECGKVMTLCEDEKTCYEIWECDGCGHKEVD